MSRSKNPDPVEDLQLEHAIAEYLRRLDGGEAVDRARFLKDHPSCAQGLEQYFEAMDQVERMAGPSLRDTLEHKEPASTAPGRTASSDGWDGMECPFPFGRYQVLRRLGRGGMGSVYLAHDSYLARDVALKIPQLNGQEKDPKWLERFIREARMNVQHPNICTIHDVGIQEGQPFFSMAYINGQPLSALVTPENLLPEGEAAALIRTVALALYAAHQAGIVHRDIKPGNIMIDDNGKPFVMDFGLAHRPTASTLTTAGKIAGTPAYMSPEQVECDPKSLTHSTDIYSLGATFYELLTGRRPFQGTLTQILTQIQNRTPQPPSQLRPGLDRQLQVVCLRMMSKRPADRFATMNEVAAELDRWLKQRTSRSETTTELQHLRRRVGILGLGGAAGFLGLGLLDAAALLSHHHHDGTEPHSEDHAINHLHARNDSHDAGWHSPFEDLMSDHPAVEKADPHFGRPEQDRVHWDGQQSYEDTCAIRCQEYILQQFTGANFEEKTLVGEAIEHGWYTPGNGTPLQDVGNLLELHGIAVNRFTDASVFHLANELAQGHKVIIGVESGQLWGHNPTMDSMLTNLHDHFGLASTADHAVVVSGIDTTDPYHVKVIISDPGDGQAVASYPLEQFLHAWEGSHFYMVATQEPAPAHLPEMAHFDYSTGHLDSIADILYEQFLDLFAHHHEAWENYLFDFCVGNHHTDDHHADSAGHDHDPHGVSDGHHADSGDHDHDLHHGPESSSHDDHDHHDWDSHHDDVSHDDQDEGFGS
jgi:serine/threonine protein kinase